MRCHPGLVASLLAGSVWLGFFVPAPAGAAVRQTIGPGIYRWFADEAARRGYVASAAFVEPPGHSEYPDASPVRNTARAAIEPVFSSFNERQTVTLPLEPGTSLYGLGEAGGPLLRNGTIVECWNSDVYGYAVGSSPLYQSHPWLLAVRADGSAFGLLADTSWRSLFDLTNGIRISAEGPPFALVVIERASPQVVVQALADLTGHMPLPPKWALGYHQCKWSYTPAARVREVAAEFRKRHMPCDAIWLDIDYMHGFRCFTFDPKAFPDPAGLNADLHAQGFHTVWMIDPGIKKEPGYSVYDSGTAADVWVKNADGTPFTGGVWPGLCVFPDFTRAATRAWWAEQYQGFLAAGVDGVWNDMNEPSVFDGPAKTMPLDARHGADAELGGPGTHAQYHNIYGMEMARGTFDGVRAGRSGKRPFVLTRAGFLGSQRYAATWTGDNTADWPHLEESVPMVLNLGLSGQPFSGPDIGGFKGMGSGALFARWMGLGAFLPFARGHSGNGHDKNKEPWSFGPKVETVCRMALEARYRLMPYLYGVFREASETGLPVARPVFFADPKDPKLRAEDDAFLIGADLLVEPQMDSAVTRRPARPRGLWRELQPLPGWGDAAYAPDLPKLFVRGGAIVPLGSVREFDGADSMEEIELVVSLDEYGQATGRYWTDSGDGAPGDSSTAQSTQALSAEYQDESVFVNVNAGAPLMRYRVTLLTAPGEQRPRRIVWPEANIKR